MNGLKCPKCGCTLFDRLNIAPDKLCTRCGYVCYALEPLPYLKKGEGMGGRPSSGISREGFHQKEKSKNDV